MKTRITIVAKNDAPLSSLGENAEEKVRQVWDLMIRLLAVSDGSIAYVESVEVTE